MPVKPTLSTVAKEAGVSIPTVSQVLRGTGRISQQTREKVLRTVEKLRYVPDSRAASMRSGENREIGFVINQLTNPFNAEVVSGVVDLLEAEGYLVSIVDTRDDAKRQSRQLEAFIRHGRGGLLWVPALATPDETFHLISKQGIPTVTFLRHVRRDLDHVGIRNAEATSTATGYLADLGHRHIAYLGGTDMTIVRKDRISGYRQLLTARELGPGIVWDSEDNKLAGRDAMLALHGATPKPRPLSAMATWLRWGQVLPSCGRACVRGETFRSSASTTSRMRPSRHHLLQRWPCAPKSWDASWPRFFWIA